MKLTSFGLLEVWCLNQSHGFDILALQCRGIIQIWGSLSQRIFLFRRQHLLVFNMSVFKGSWGDGNALTRGDGFLRESYGTVRVRAQSVRVQWIQPFFSNANNLLLRLII